MHRVRPPLARSLSAGCRLLLACRPDMGASRRGPVASTLNLLLLEMRGRWGLRHFAAWLGKRLPRRQRSPGTSVPYHALGLDDPGTRLVFAAKSRHRRHAAVRLVHLDVEAAVSPRHNKIR